MKENKSVTLFWFRRDLRIEDNRGLFEACTAGNVQPIFIFDDHILEELPKNDPRVQFIYQELEKIATYLKSIGSSLLVKKGVPIDVWKDLTDEFTINRVVTNKDFEPYGIDRDRQVAELLSEQGIPFELYTDHVFFEPGEITKDDGLPYTIYTPFKKKWLAKYETTNVVPYPSPTDESFVSSSYEFPSLKEIGFETNSIEVRPITFENVKQYHENRDFPAIVGTTSIGPHLRFGTIGLRKILLEEAPKNATFLSELIWREFFIQILYHFPKVVNQSFKIKYDNINWLNNEDHFKKWCNGRTGYPIVDAGMRELNSTGYMHNRVRMVVASFLCKHLLIDWRWGEAYFAEKLLDFELASNNGNWQWAAGTGCDAAPYFRVFNPAEQLKKFDAKMEYIKRWVPELFEGSYPSPIVDHKMARLRAIDTYKKGLSEI